MRLSLSNALLGLAAVAAPLASAERFIESKSLNPCMANSGFSATLFNVALTPNNRSLDFKIEGISNIAGKIEADMELLVYGFPAMTQKLDPCGNEDLKGMCPMNAGPLTIKSNLDISEEVMSQIPGTSSRPRLLVATPLTSCRHCVHHPRLGPRRAHQDQGPGHTRAACLRRG